MATATRKRRKTTRRTSKDQPVASGTTYHALDQDGNGLTHPRTLKPIKPSASGSVVLTQVQTFAEQTPEENTYYVERRFLFGPPVDVYAVRRDEHGTVFTTTLTTEV